MTTVENTTTEASGLAPQALPIGKDTWNALQADIKDLCMRWTDQTCSAEVETGQLERVDAQAWLLRCITITEAVKMLAADMQERLLVGAKDAGASNGQIGRARGVRGETVRQRLARR